MIIVIPGQKKKLDGVAAYCLDFITKLLLETDKRILLVCSERFWRSACSSLEQLGLYPSALKRVSYLKAVLLFGENSVIVSPSLLVLPLALAPKRRILVIFHDFRVFNEMHWKAFFKRKVYKICILIAELSAITHRVKSQLSQLSSKNITVKPNSFAFIAQYKKNADQNYVNERRFDVVVFDRSEPHKRTQDALDVLSGYQFCLSVAVISTDQSSLFEGSIRRLRQKHSITVFICPTIVDVYDVLRSSRLCLIPSAAEGLGRIVGECLTLETTPLIRDLPAYKEFFKQERVPEELVMFPVYDHTAANIKLEKALSLD